MKTVNAGYYIKWKYVYSTGVNLLVRSEFSYLGYSLLKRGGTYFPIWGSHNFNSYTDLVYDTVIKVNSQRYLFQSYNKLPFGSPNSPMREIETSDGRPVQRVISDYKGKWVTGIGSRDLYQVEMGNVNECKGRDLKI